MNKLFVCPDLHEAPNLDEVEAAIQREAPTRTIFLGDYFDQFDDTPEDAGRTAVWLKSSLAQPNRIHLWGNHDLAYGFSEIQEAWCSGFTWEKCNAINAVLSPDDWTELQLSHWEDGFLFSHAGWTNQFSGGSSLAQVSDRRTHLTAEEVGAWRCLKIGKRHWIWGAGYLRGGTQPCGGLLWCDVREFTPIPGLNQIFGHTSGNLGTVKRGRASFNLCLDTCSRKMGAQHYVIVDGRGVQVKRLDGEVVRLAP